MKLNFNLLGLLFIGCLCILSCGKDEEEDEISPTIECGNFTCENGSTCVDGVCDCPVGYSGNSCETRLDPTNVKLTGVLVKDFPVSDPFGTAWDDDGKADLTFAIYEETDLLYAHTEIATDADPNDDHGFTVTTFTFVDPNTNYIIRLLDSDGAGADEMSSYTFKPVLPIGTSGILSLTGGSSQIDLTLEYIY